MATAMFQPNATVGTILSCATAVHRALGPGLLESAYDRCLACELAWAGLRFRRQAPLPVTYREASIDCAYRLDFVVEDEVLIEIKSVEKLVPLHFAQMRTYLRLSGLRRGLLLNFNDRLLKTGTYSFLGSLSEPAMR
jgi:GxxExxY protein